MHTGQKKLFLKIGGAQWSALFIKLAWRRTQPYAIVNGVIVLDGGGRKRAVPLELSVELPMEQRNAVLGGQDTVSKGCVA
eukprot:4182005-Pyramimonas_sp.AAC.1